MESTLVGWIPAYEVLERAGFEVMLAPPRMTKQDRARCVRDIQNALTEMNMRLDSVLADSPLRRNRAAA